VHQDRSVDISRKAFERLVHIIRVRSGIALGVYKEQYIRRRLDIRMRARRCPSVEEYCDILVRDRGEMGLLLQVLTVTVSHFFRNPATFDALRSEVLPLLFERAAARQEGLRIWSVGCAEGEEPYSLAILLRESFAEQLGRLPVAIRATDISQAALERARDALYGPERLKEVPPVLRDRYFFHEGEGFRVAPPVRSMVEFAPLDLSVPGEHPASDLILCRNVMIYFEREHQERFLASFAGALGSGGILVLGKSEVLAGSARHLFRTVSSSERIYRVN
jgi:chemotaxis protein methyltransferase CheR